MMRGIKASDVIDSGDERGSGDRSDAWHGAQTRDHRIGFHDGRDTLVCRSDVLIERH